MSSFLPAAAVPKLPVASGFHNQTVKQFEAATLLDSLPVAIISLDAQDCVTSVNAAAEALLGVSRAQLLARSLSEQIAADSPLFTLIRAARFGVSNVVDADISLAGPRFRIEHAAVDVVAFNQPAGHVAFLLRDRSLEWRLSQQSISRDAARSARCMAAILAHEVKNPLSGIRGAAQLLESKLSLHDRQLTQLICDETDRIVGMVNELEVFTDARPLSTHEVNIHEILSHVRCLGQAGFARDIVINEEYDPSLPHVLGNRSQLIQVFLNLLKNSVEAAPKVGGIIVLRTRFRPGLCVNEPGQISRRRLSLSISIEDNGSGVPETLKSQLFEPFVSSKAGGKGLGLAVVAKIIADHGGLIDYESQPGRTIFSVILPITDESRGA